jgi:AhpD family alkylhydroperoxidase
MPTLARDPTDVPGADGGSVDRGRVDYPRVAPGAVRAQHALSAYVRDAGFAPALLELVALRASYLNGCAYCVDRHAKDARAAGEGEQRVYSVPVWRKMPCYTPRERAALAWTDAVTRLGVDGVPDAVYAEARGAFDERELVDLTMAVIAINGWNRLAISFRQPAGAYAPPARR